MAQLFLARHLPLLFSWSLWEFLSLSDLSALFSILLFTCVHAKQNKRGCVILKKCWFRLLLLFSALFISRWRDNFLFPSRQKWQVYFI